MSSRIATTAAMLAVAAGCALVGAAPAGAAPAGAPTIGSNTNCGTADHVYLHVSAISGTTRIYVGPLGGTQTLVKTLTGNNQSYTDATGRHSASWHVTFTGPDGSAFASCE